jgi:transaldolase
VRPRTASWKTSGYAPPATTGSWRPLNDLLSRIGSNFKDGVRQILSTAEASGSYTSLNKRTDATALISVNQVMLAAKAGATYASIFFNRVKDAGEDTERVVRESRALLDRMNTPTKIIVGSIRKPEDVAQAAIAGAHIVTIPYKILTQMPLHEKTEETIAEFDRAWQEFKLAEKGP